MIFGHQANDQSDTSTDAHAAMNDADTPQMTPPPADLPATNDDLSTGGVLDQPGGMPDLSQPNPDSTGLSDESGAPAPAPSAPQDSSRSGRPDAS